MELAEPVGPFVLVGPVEPARIAGLAEHVGPVATGLGLVALLAVFAGPLRAAAPVAYVGAVQPYVHLLLALVAAQSVAVPLDVPLPVVAPLVAVLLAFADSVLASIVAAPAVAPRSDPVILLAALVVFLAALLIERLAVVDAAVAVLARVLHVAV